MRRVSWVREEGDDAVEYGVDEVQGGSVVRMERTEEMMLRDAKEYKAFFVEEEEEEKAGARDGWWSGSYHDE